MPAARNRARAAGRSTPRGLDGTTWTRTPRSCRAVRRPADARRVVITVVAASGPRICAVGGNRSVESSTPLGRRSSDEADGQERVVRHAHADEYGIARGPQRVRDAALGLAADPFGIARGRGDASVKRLSELEHDVGPVLSGPYLTEQSARVDGWQGAGFPGRHRRPGRIQVVHPALFGAEIAEVAGVRRGRQRLNRHH